MVKQDREHAAGLAGWQVATGGWQGRRDDAVRDRRGAPADDACATRRPARIPQIAA